MKRQSSAFFLCLLVVMMPLSGCILDQQFKGELVGTFDIENLGVGTTNTNDTIASFSLINYSYNNLVQFNDDTGSQDGSDYFRFRILIGDLNDASRPAFECRIQTQSPGDCIILESVDDGIWEIDEIITFQENDADICAAGCLVQLTIMNGDIITEAEENLKYIGQEAIGSGSVTHTANFWMGQ